MVTISYIANCSMICKTILVKLQAAATETICIQYNV